MSIMKPLLLLLVGLILGAGGGIGYKIYTTPPVPESRTVMARFILRAPAAQCKQIMAQGFRAANFPTVTSDSGEGVGVGASAPEALFSGAALCMQNFGIAAVAITGPDAQQRVARMQAFAGAVDATINRLQPAPAQPQRR